MYDYQAEVTEVHDGDTVIFTIDMGMYIRSEQRIRFLGVFAPELNEPGGIAARDFVKRWVTRHRTHTPKDDWSFHIFTEKDNRSFNRYIGTIKCVGCGLCLNDAVNKYLGVGASVTTKSNSKKGE